MQLLMGNLSNQLVDIDNEMIVQMLVNALATSMQILPNAQNLNNETIMETINMATVLIGFRVHLEDITRDSLSKIIYYARITPDYQLLRSPYHPIKLMDYMDGNIPESYQNLFSDRDYLPNIVCVWDRGDADHYTLVNFQTVRIHYNASAPHA